MTPARYFLDTSFVVANLDGRDQNHVRARAMRPLFDGAQVVTTEAVLIEIGNALSSGNRTAASRFILSCYRAPLFKVVEIDAARLLRGVNLYCSRGDKQWGLTDCLSFEVMREEGLIDALTADRHFVQAGFRALMLEDMR